MKGKVYLIGAGPGDPGLLTLKAVGALKRADTIVFDRLINYEILKLARPGAELIDVGKMPGHHPVPQEMINRILAEKAGEGRTVARLKGGDPFVFGRGGEEALFLKEKGIPFEVIPGVTSAVSVSAYAGIPLTHRDFASSFHVFTGHEAGAREDNPDWEAISKLNGTLVFLMGVNNMDFITKSLIKYGKSAAAPAAVIMNGTIPAQRVVVGSLADISEKARKNGIKSPAVMVMGDVVNLRQDLNWYETKKLFGKRILITGMDQREEWEEGFIRNDPVAALIHEGAEVIHCPALKIIHVLDNIERLLDEIVNYDILIFTSKHGVESFSRAMREKRFDVRKLNNIRIAAVGSKTKEKLEGMQIYPDIMPREFTSNALLDVIKEEKIGKNAAVITSDIGGKDLMSGLERLGLKPRKIIAYKNRPNYKIRGQFLEEFEKGIDIVIFTSPSTFYYMKEIAGETIGKISKSIIAAIGPTTKKAIEGEGYRVDVIPREHTLEGVIREILEYKNL
jgi:uroporphyrinogen III methyltransferase/synthase